MASITIKNIDTTLKTRLRKRAASSGRSMQAEARAILEAALERKKKPAEGNLADAIRNRFEPLGGVELPIPRRQRIRNRSGFGA